LRMRAALG